MSSLPHYINWTHPHTIHHYCLIIAVPSQLQLLLTIPQCSQRLYSPYISNFEYFEHLEYLDQLDCLDCWNSKHCQPNTSTFVHLYIDGFSCHYQLMPSAGMFVPVILFHYHMILFSNSPLFSLPSFLHDSLTMRFRTFPVPLYLVIFVSCPQIGRAHV